MKRLLQENVFTDGVVSRRQMMTFRFYNVNSTFLKSQ